MAENQTSENENIRAASADAGGGLLGAILGGAAGLWHALTDDGYLAAAGRQGFDELGAALKAFPDSIQVDEIGTLWSPTQGEIASARDISDSGPPHPWPSEIANENRNQPDTGNGYENGKDTGYSM